MADTVLNVSAARAIAPAGRVRAVRGAVLDVAFDGAACRAIDEALTCRREAAR